MRHAVPLVLSLLTACGDDASGPPVDAAAAADAAAPPDLATACGDAAVPPTTDCTATNACAALAVAGDAPAPNSGSFHGFADPSLFADPADAKRVWLAYSWPHGVLGKDPQGNTVAMAAVSTHLARSDDGGATFTYVGEPWPALPVADPEGSGENGIDSSETPSLVALGGAWYAAHLRYFLQPQTGYHPKYATSWTVHVAAAPSPAALAGAPEAVLGVSATAAAYMPDARLDQLAGLPLAQCAILNNPTLFAGGGALYLVVECLAFTGQTMDVAHSTTQVFATTPGGAPSSWSWRYVGRIADHALAVELADDTVQQPDVSLAADGTPLLVVTPAHLDPMTVVGTVGDGCAAIELASIEPPTIKRDCAGRAIVRARVAGASLGACTHHAASATGILATSDDKAGGNWALHATGARP